ncbi:MAG TPA: magnesium and cobalt transport protein CorA [Porphyromonadaceae bacterium]|jgi:magnesium transporter|uniref:Cobalt/magnesium transport protein CorA n=1 Tax=bioreactor metagenome TaxID=1076179 RepID=A0A644XR76_9ZZZZ|nr:magnesium/cobalt transporter CorA [Petrimonas sp.]NLU30375.1 magnesium/cobalt transporter CorA [Bacteroidales bacterium]BBD45524.1 Magnesium and cobalt transport protein CorA [Petrimonas sp. IBARAKI]HAC72335.1 magnesium and cobalt transport protein CorA [Porphyromonadaceae bacterium]MDD3541424.1 magnesium/cobalt transporter CorA [Petrimonas sp.]
MPYIPHKKKEDIGLSPYELKFRGKKKAEDIRVQVIDFDLEGVRETEIKDTGELRKYLSSDSITWINVDGLHNEQIIRDLSDIFSIPADILSDVMEPSSRPQAEEFDNGFFVSIKMMEFNEKKNRVSVDNLSLIVMDKILVTFQEEKGDVFEPVRERIRKHKTKIRTSGSDYLAFTLLDVVIDNYIYILGVYGEKVETLEGKLILDTNKETLKIINLFKHELNNLRVDIKPAKEMIMGLVKLDTDFIQEENEKHYKELQDNINQAVDLLDYYREVLYDELNMYHSSMSTKLNDTMTVLTIFSVIFIPLTFIVGVYGMNFDNFPELHWKYGYFIVWGIMLLIVAGMIGYFKKRKWF